jgi:intergrase/recombinase
MKALASLSKFIGEYDGWKNIVQRYQLKWSDSNKSIKVFNAIFQNEGNTHSSMLSWIKNVISVLPKDYQDILLFNTLTGLRQDEAQKAIWLIKTKVSEYVDKERGILKHYQFPSIFLRQTKNAYVSVLNDQIIEIAKATPNKERYMVGLRKRVLKKGYKMNMYYCRKVFATYLRNKGIEPEIIDLLQGRISSSVFVNHYYRPDINEIITKRIRPVLDELQEGLLS